MLNLILFFSPVPPQQAEPVSQEPAVSATAMSGRIRGLRRDLIAGGGKVRSAESEATGFYREKMGALDKQADRLAVDLAEKRAGYDLALDRTLSAHSASVRTAAAADAARQRRDIDVLESEIEALNVRRQELARAIELVDARTRERERLAAGFEAGASRAREPFISTGGLGLAPQLPAAGSGDPFADDALLQDLMARDPERARGLVLEVDPERYWLNWPLAPPAELLRKAIRFPLGDPPDRR